MTVQESKETVVKAGKRLVESGLIARTWGNVSCRISSTHFVITPSGRDYLSLTPEEIVEVAIADCSYSGDIKPSSEKGIHAEVYKLHPEINFVIHTHQDFASAVSVLDLESINANQKYETLKGLIICADYGLPGTNKLRKNVAKALAKTRGHAVIMKNHGALVFGENYEKTFQAATELEYTCEQFIQEQYIKLSGNTVISPVHIGEFAVCSLLGKYNGIKNGSAKKMVNSHPKADKKLNVMDEALDVNEKPAQKTDILQPLANNQSVYISESERKSNGFRLLFNNISYDFTFDNFDNLPADNSILRMEARLHNDIYKYKKAVNFILHAKTNAITAVSYAGIKILPLLDDFAQIAGTSVWTEDDNAGKIISKLKHASMVFIKNNGAICLGSTKGDALAVSLVGEKNSNALISAALFGKIKYINHFECVLMRLIYLKKYSKQAYQK